MVALVGSSGNGKSTIAALLARIYDPKNGRITIDGQDIRNVDSKWLRGELIGYVGQEPTLFKGSVRDNIRYGKPEATDFEVEEAAKLANAHEFIQGTILDLTFSGNILPKFLKKSKFAEMIFKNFEIFEISFVITF